MKPRDLGELVLLAAIWGASFLLMRLGAGHFGPLALVWVRVAGAALVLLPILALRGEGGALRSHWKTIALVGITNSALPFTLFSYAVLTITGSLASVFNAATPLFGGLIGWLWLGQVLSTTRAVGLVVGFAGVFGLALNQAGLRPGAGGHDAALAVAACLLAALSYGYSANYTKKHAATVAPLALATGSQIAAAVVLAPAAWLAWPAEAPGAVAWMAALGLAVVCTGFAYILYFRLIAHAGATNALAVTFLVPAFAVAWSAALLGEWPTPAMYAGCAVILVGTALATGLLQPRRRQPAPAPAPARERPLRSRQPCAGWRPARGRTSPRR